ncbi:Two-component transcriptional response regulator, LuxR family [uncultured Synechococcales cyanobacterium]|uniref:Two-component transcriptional response regulator, LuxR family n=1 Tax=uncultured Synechococcales cyanobacterium TaxID=1936017 RepID=A0A6J4VVM2_9CYAN|nr:Two-component transcriptional response regulator, LuxR family [uncultured Synechococcales cyanobacterium]
MTGTTILLADDDPDEYQLIREALAEEGLLADDPDEYQLICGTPEAADTSAIDLRWVKNGEELLDYLYHRGKYQDLQSLSLPNLILLDLDMPRKDGREVLQEIKSDPKLRYIPIILMTNSYAEEEILHTYELGANSFITKPETFKQMAETLRSLHTYWFKTVKLPT